ncbi:glycogen debranching N-terminal domain-containing protein [Conexibacter sp. DBS9H8]|uniref:amylo-alpha-1,6-glucosidase n=1 Tax=Conexibacter sp. DBS9H8 TaxID=2937801 RepID=UPI00200F9E12|nr:glycogen debranching N-terminal domain-containing protein [Conexibacter sp. DBS9H8]
MSEDAISVLDGSTFVVSDRRGDVSPEAGAEHGFFAQDTRFLARWSLSVGERPLELLSLHQGTHYESDFILTPQVAPEEQAPCSVIRRRLIDRVWLEEVTVTNHLHTPVAWPVTLTAAAEFADLFEVKSGPVAPRPVTVEHDDRTLTFAYRAGGFHRAVTITASRPGTVTPNGFAFALELAAAEQWSVTFTILSSAAQPGTRFTARVPRGSRAEMSVDKAAELARWTAAAPVLDTANEDLARTYRASLSDLAALRMAPDLRTGLTLPAAGLPWFMALFGRDSLITSLQALPYLPSLAATTLTVLAARQATTRDDFHEQEPGKILHELRFGELTATGQRPHSPYFGSADATPLFLILLDEYHRWTGDSELVARLEPNARAALTWIADSGDIDGDGYVEYARRNVASGLVNQCWKDSWDSIQFADGHLAHGPIATCEIQGYVYDAQRRAARLARTVWHDEALAVALEGRAERLAAQFRRDFWLPERGTHALALDGDKRPVDGLCSNIGHLLWSGIVDDAEAALTAAALLGEDLYSGWGVRTLARSAAGYNPLGYHTGTVWPHDNSLIAAGLARYGHTDAAGQIATAMLAAAPFFQYRLPEVFAGFPAADTSVPVAFPTASRPQAWAAGTPLLLLSTLLGLTPGDEPVTGVLAAPVGAVTLRRPGAASDREPMTGRV